MIHDSTTSCRSAMKTPPMAMNGADIRSVADMSTSIWTC